MGIEHHHCVIAVQWDKDEIKAFKRWSKKNTDCYLISEPKNNGYVTIVLVADGSKEGWEESNVGNKRRAGFIKWMDSRAYSDGSNSWKYVEVGLGELGTQVLNYNCREYMY